MNKQLVAQKSVLEAILEWSLERPAWQRDALRRIVAKGRLDEDDIKQLVQLCKAEHDPGEGGPKAIPLEKAHLPANPGEGSAVSLISVADVSGVNNLAPGQTLAFEPTGLTVIYGDNGAGKSGYARILKRACRARHAGKIETNVYDDQAPKIASANITYSTGGIGQPQERWQDGPQAHAQLSAISVFDSECASVHLKDKNEVAFRPFGLDVPDELASVCQSVKEALTAEQKQLEKARNPIFAAPPWKATTAIGKALAGLTADTDRKKVEAAATLSQEDSSRLERLKNDLAKNPVKAATEQTLKADNIKRVIAVVRAADTSSTYEALLSVSQAVDEARAKREAARIASEQAFGGEAIAGIGAEVWRALWESARRYSTEAAYPGQPFPPTHEQAHCVLCLQPLEREAMERMVRFDQFVQQDTAVRAERAASSARTALLSIVMRTRQIKAALDEIALLDAGLAGQVRCFIAGARLRRHVLLRSLNAQQEVILPLRPESPLAALANREAELRKYADELRQSVGADERKALEAELAELQDRSLLAGSLPAVLDEIQRLGAIRFLDSCISDTATNAITKIGNDIADTVITPRLTERFREEIARLAAEKVRVEIVRSGGKYGSPQYQVRLSGKAGAKVHDVLSEGERTCVALAAFMTELATAAHQSALVFDDPVSSLDHRWRKKVAERLVAEAAQRQVIVFTHDLIFVNDLLDLTNGRQLPIRMTTVGRGATGAGVATDGLPWKGQRVEDRIDKLEKAAREAKQFYDNNQEAEYEVAAARIYDQLRASWERGLEDIAFARVVVRHRDYIDAKALKKVSILSVADCDAYAAGFKKCCDVVDAHDPSGARNAGPPPPADLFQDIQALKDWAASLRDRQKQVS